MSKVTWYEAVRKALHLMTRGNVVYFYGAKGQTLTTPLMLALWDAEQGYFSRYTEDEKIQIFRNSIGKIGVDCSGFTGLCTGDMSYSVAQKMNSKPNASPAEGPAGSLLFTSFNGSGKHVGLDLGYGYFINTTVESTDENIKRGKAGIWIGKISEFNWEYSGQSNCVDYEGATNR